MIGLLIIKQDPWAPGVDILDAGTLISCREGTEHVDVNGVARHTLLEDHTKSGTHIDERKSLLERRADLTVTPLATT